MSRGRYASANERRPTRGSDWAVGRPPPRGELRRQHPGAVAAVVLTGVVAGVFLPLFGLSLAAFLVVDVVLAGLKANRA